MYNEIYEQKRYLREELKKIHLEPEEEKLDRLYTFYEMVKKKNEVMNLTAITEYEEFVKKHFIDSLMVLGEDMLWKPEGKLLDMGTGAGFPGIPLKIFYPDIHMVLVDSLKKRVLFLEEVVKELGLVKIELVHARAEDLARRKEYREQFAYCTSRAVANLSTLVEYCIPFLKLDGIFFVYKGSDVEEELREAEYAIGKLGGTIKEKKEYALPETDMGRSLICIQKTASTPAVYPRSAGKPAREPLKRAAKQAGEEVTGEIAKQSRGSSRRDSKKAGEKRKEMGGCM